MGEKRGGVGGGLVVGGLLVSWFLVSGWLPVDGYSSLLVGKFSGELVAGWCPSSDECPPLAQGSSDDWSEVWFLVSGWRPVDGFSSLLVG
ncbi:hypothetical protein GGR26_003145 [Lewinella marina]|uniref:hypothetical protein n=1 Tax=Neolewinella marina TaxID=438751 RepID=UPI00117AEB43|nr:hypothetical protein [Neolewinella marina]NJB87365.1 hypothetical protein [Neolewinella marina]